MILLDVQPSRTYFVSLFEELGLTPNIAFSSPSIEMVRGMVGQGFGFSLLVTRPHSECTYDGKKVVMVDLAEPVSTSARRRLAETRATDQAGTIVRRLLPGATGQACRAPALTLSFPTFQEELSF